MVRISLSAYTDPARRPKAVIWTGVALLGCAALVIVALGVTSTYWFCANGCHKVQDDTIIAYDASSHANVSCMACHMPVNANPITFVVHKAEALGELYLTATGRFELPLNSRSELAEEMESRQCTQCHSENRVATPSSGIIIDHPVHAENEVGCAMCHNRVAHPEDFELTLAGNGRHEDFMKMEGCFRCHGLESGAKAPGACEACHPASFELKPGNHYEPGFYTRGGDSKGHATLKKERSDYCRMCHLEVSFCSGCHGLEMPHPSGFQANHGALGKASPGVCANCHASGDVAVDAGMEFCNSCHHQGSDPTRSWISQHFDAVRSSGAAACFDCHRSTYCAGCHVTGSAN